MQALVDDGPLLDVLRVPPVVVLLLVGEVRGDGVAVPEDEIAVLDGRHRVEGVDLDEVRLHVLALQEADLLELVLDAQRLEHQQHPSDGRAQLVAVQDDGHGGGGGGRGSWLRVYGMVLVPHSTDRFYNDLTIVPTAICCLTITSQYIALLIKVFL